ncbi:unnamed protein product [Rhizophagus irregularis]|uniref:Protein kinase domain-containing protein n=1 Tax=Rhizophagus irregularis TaxID=588596 RepID=A0A916E1T0_9GLOM|nr:unnamed protein product [Rhizophagus irregularis]
MGNKNSRQSSFIAGRKKCKYPYLHWKRLRDNEAWCRCGFSIVYSAEWYDLEKRLSWAAPSKARPVALKSIKNSQDMTSEYINELQTHYRCVSATPSHVEKMRFDHGFLRFFGITQDPETHDYIMVTELAPYHDLRLRPSFAEGTPENYVRLATQCFHMNPSERPDARFLAHTFNNWWNLTQEDNVLSNAFITADEKISELDTSFNKHPDAIYTSRLITFENSDSNSSDKTLNYLPPNVVKQI